MTWRKLIQCIAIATLIFSFSSNGIAQEENFPRQLAALDLEDGPAANGESSMVSGSEDEKRRLIETISKLRDAARLDASRQLEEDPEIQRLRDERQVPKPLGEALPLCLDTPSKDCLLREALAFGYQVPDAERRDWILADLARVYTEHGLYEQARRVAVLVNDPRYALRISDAITAALQHDTNFESETERAPDKSSPHSSIRFAEDAKAAFETGNHEAGLQLLERAAQARKTIDGPYMRAFAEFQAAEAYRSAIQNALDESLNAGQTEAYYQAMFALTEGISQAQLGALSLLRLEKMAGVNRRRAIERRAEQKIDEIATDVRKIYFLTGLTNEDASRDFLQTAWARAARLSEALIEPWTRARAFLRLAETYESR